MTVHESKDLAVEIFGDIGVCCRDHSGKVFFQNKTCKFLCSDMEGKICQQRCRLPANEKKVNNSIGIARLSGSDLQDLSMECVSYRKNNMNVSLLFPLLKNLETSVNAFAQFGLTKAELQIVSSRLLGMTNKQIAAKLFISIATVKTHMSNIHRKVPESLQQKLGKVTDSTSIGTTSFPRERS